MEGNKSETVTTTEQDGGEQETDSGESKQARKQESEKKIEQPTGPIRPTEQAARESKRGRLRKTESKREQETHRQIKTETERATDRERLGFVKYWRSEDD